MEVYYVWDVIRRNPSKPGEVDEIRVRARVENYARFAAAAMRGQEPLEEWLDPERSTAVCHGEAAVQWAGVVRVLGHGHFLEGPDNVRVVVAGEIGTLNM